MACISKDICSFNTEQMLYGATNKAEFSAGLHALCENDYLVPVVHDFCNAISSGDIESFFPTKLLKQIIESPILSFVFSHLTDWRLSTPLHHIAYDTESTESKFGLNSYEFNHLLALLAQNGDVNAENIIGSTPLHEAADRANSFMVHFLSRLPQINPNANNAFFKNSPLHLAVIEREGESEKVKQKRDEITQQLLSHPEIDPNVPNQAGDTAAHYAVSSGNLFALQALASNSKTDLCIQNSNANTPAHLLIGNDANTVDGQMYETLLSANPSCFNLHNRRDQTAIDALIQNGESGLPFEEVDKEIQD